MIFEFVALGILVCLLLYLGLTNKRRIARLRKELKEREDQDAKIMNAFSKRLGKQDTLLSSQSDLIANIAKNDAINEAWRHRINANVGYMIGRVEYFTNKPATSRKDHKKATTKTAVSLSVVIRAIRDFVMDEDDYMELLIMNTNYIASTSVKKDLQIILEEAKAEQLYEICQIVLSRASTLNIVLDENRS